MIQLQRIAPKHVYGEAMMDYLIEAVNPASGGSYTSVGTYHHTELTMMIAKLSERTQKPTAELTRAFGHYLARTFVVKFPDFFKQARNTLEFLKRIDNHIHVEVAKLYPDAELPEFSFDDTDPDVFILNFAEVENIVHNSQKVSARLLGNFQRALFTFGKLSIGKNI
ncbi:MAG: heme NO-binding domain-containing protein, partial [Reinekea sp.]